MIAPASFVAAAPAQSPHGKSGSRLGLLVRLLLCLALWSAGYLYGRYGDSRGPDWQSLAVMAALGALQVGISVWSWRQHPFPQDREQIPAYVVGKAVVIIGGLCGLAMCLATLVAGSFDYFYSNQSKYHHALPFPPVR